MLNAKKQFAHHGFASANLGSALASLLDAKPHGMAIIDQVSHDTCIE